MKVRAQLATHTSFSGGRALAEALAPSADYGWVHERLQETAEAMALIDLATSVGLGGVHDVRPVAEQAVLGALLTPGYLQDVRDTLEGGRSIKRIIERFVPRVPTLWSRIETLPDCRELELAINRCISPRGEVLDAASPALARLRAEVRSAHDRLLDFLNRVMNSARGRTQLQEPLITQRNGRYVLPVKSDFRGEFRGIVHDVSSSGATLFMEPIEAIELGNDWRQRQIEEAQEVERVLRELSLLVADYSADIIQTVETLTWLDLTLAKAKYAQQMRATVPVIEAPRPPREDKPGPRLAPLRLLEARHPLLTGHVVPLSLELGEDYYALLITGPNTGGKTVALKTVGLLVLMAQAGMALPAAEGTRLPLYREVFADIGDEQSIEQSLSTFSAHLRNIISILREAGDECLVVLDELGAGTDPAEGSALARAILTYLLDHRVTTIATTHHSDLKAFAHNTPGIRNASVEFDMETLAPTYRLTVGIPGRSNAIAIARRLGLQPELVEAAQRLVHPEELQVESLLAELQRERDAANRLRRRADSERQRAESARERWEARVHELEAQREQSQAEARQRLVAETAQVRSDLQRATQAIERALRDQRKERLVAAGKALEQADNRLGGRRWQRQPRRSQTATEPLHLAVGDWVHLKGLGQTGEVASAPDEDGELEVLLGNFRAKVRVDQLEPAAKAAVPAGQAARPSAGWGYASAPAAAEYVEPELHLRGQRVEEALVHLDEYLDDAFRAGLPWVRIVHGKGTGTMRQAVREMLTGHPLVRSFETAAREQGGEGVTVANLAQ